MEGLQPEFKVGGEPRGLGGSLMAAPRHRREPCRARGAPLHATSPRATASLTKPETLTLNPKP